MGWEPIETLPDNVVAILYQPAIEDRYQGEGMIIGSIERWISKHTGKQTIWVNPHMVGGFEMECDLQNPTLWQPLPAPPHTKGTGGMSDITAIWDPFSLGWMAGLDSLDPRECPFEKMTSEWHEWQSAHGKAVEYKREREKELGGK